MNVGNHTVTMAKGGTAEREVRIKDIEVPDMWHVAMKVMGADAAEVLPGDGALILECWHLAHDLLKHIKGE